MKKIEGCNIEYDTCMNFDPITKEEFGKTKEYYFVEKVSKDKVHLIDLKSQNKKVYDYVFVAYNLKIGKMRIV